LPPSTFAAVVNNLQAILDKFDPITLAEMDSVRLMNRTDTKYIFNVNRLPEILGECLNDYRTLEVEGNRMSAYETRYFDTSDLRFYRLHHSGKLNRHKVRYRKYVESDLIFLEVKFKTNKDRTIKNRMVVPHFEEQMTDESVRFLRDISGIEFELNYVLTNSFKRITLVNLHTSERVTIDVDIAFWDKNRKAEVPGLVIAEVKQEKYLKETAFVKALKKRLIRPEGMSKYCAGCYLLRADVKKNNFKEKINKINKIENEIAA
jgi:hypothetical protein